MIIIYKVTSPSNKVYVGITSTSLQERKRKHKNLAFKGRKGKFPEAIRKYKDSLLWEVLELVEDWKTATEKEINYIQQYNSFNSGYNCTLGGDGVLGTVAWNKGKTNIYSEEVLKNNCINNGAKLFDVYFKNGNYVGRWLNQTQCARDLILNNCHINSCLKNKLKSHGGYIFKYVEDVLC